MLELIADMNQKRDLQSTMQNQLQEALPYQGIKKVGNPGGTDELHVYSRGQGYLWYAHQIAPTPHDEKSGRAKKAIKRHWNAFGIFDKHAPVQSITVEINIPIELNSGIVAGFFAKDADSGQTFLMHSGRVGGGRMGIGKAAFLLHSACSLEDVTTLNGVRQGIRVARISSNSITLEICEFVEKVASFKLDAAS